MITSRYVEEVACAGGFRPDVVEKVLRLRNVLARLDRHPVTSGAWVLKGGTALNLLYMEVPRLSVDIDINYVGEVDVDRMREARPEFERALVSACEREGLTVKRTPTEHAGGKFRLRYSSVIGGMQNIEIDVSYVARVPLLGTERRKTLFPPGEPVEVPALTLPELAAGKFTALAQRGYPRDSFDAALLLKLKPDLLEDPGFRLAFVCSMAGGHFDPRDIDASSREPDMSTIDSQLVPLLRLEADGSSPAAGLLDWIRHEQGTVVAGLLDWSEGERLFLDRLHDEGVIEPGLLHSELEVRERIRSQPILQWKALNARKFREGKAAKK